MKKIHVVLIAVVGVLVILATTIYSPMAIIFGSTIIEIASGANAEIEIDSYRLCESKDGEDIIIIKYLLKNGGKNPTSLIYEGEFSVYQNGVSLTEYTEALPKECNYDTEDQYKNIKGGVEYYAEIAYYLDEPDADVEVEVDDYGLFDGKKEKVFKLK